MQRVSARFWKSLRSVLGSVLELNILPLVPITLTLSSSWFSAKWYACLSLKHLSPMRRSKPFFSLSIEVYPIERLVFHVIKETWMLGWWWQGIGAMVATISQNLVELRAQRFEMSSTSSSVSLFRYASLPRRVVEEEPIIKVFFVFTTFILSLRMLFTCVKTRYEILLHHVINLVNCMNAELHPTSRYIRCKWDSPYKSSQFVNMKISCYLSHRMWQDLHFHAF